jgi:hypothetical protein
MNLKGVINNLKAYKQTKLNYSNGQLIIDKDNIIKKSTQTFLKRKRIFGKNILNTILTDIYENESKFRKNRKSLSNNGDKKKKKIIEKTLKSKNKINNNIKKINKKACNNTNNSKLLLEKNKSLKQDYSILIDNKKDYNSHIISLYDNKNLFKKEPIIENYNYEKNHEVTQNDLQYVKEYQEEIFSYLTSLEKKININPNYIKEQKDITEKMREILIDWIINVHLKFKLLKETLFLSIILIDRYLQNVQISRKNLQLVGVASLLISCKYEEIYLPSIKSFIYITDNAYEKEELLDMERNILSNLGYDISYPSLLRYMEMLFVKLNYVNDIFLTNKMYFLLELLLTKLIFYKYTHIELVIACFLLSFKSNDDNYEQKKEELIKKCFSCFYIFYDKNKVDKIDECIDELENTLKDIFNNKNSFKTLLKKYALEKYGCISQHKFWENIIDS